MQVWRRIGGDLLHRDIGWPGIRPGQCLRVNCEDGTPH